MDSSDAQSVEPPHLALSEVITASEVSQCIGSDADANSSSTVLDAEDTEGPDGSQHSSPIQFISEVSNMSLSIGAGSPLGNSVIIFSPFGGSGKTLFGQLVRLSLERNGVSFRHVVADQCGPHGKSTTGALFSSVVDLGAGETSRLSSGSLHENSGLKYWDRLGDLLVKGDAIVELGTNVFAGPIAWAKKRRAGKIIERLSNQSQCLVLILPRPYLTSTDVRALIEPFLDVASWRIKRIVICVNDHQGVGSDPVELVLDLGTKERVEVVHIRMPHCTSSLLPKLQTMGIPLPSCKVAEFIASSDFSNADTWEVTGAAHDLFDWMDAIIPEVFSVVVLS